MGPSENPSITFWGLQIGEPLPIGICFWAPESRTPNWDLQEQHTWQSANLGVRTICLPTYQFVLQRVLSTGNGVQEPVLVRSQDRSQWVPLRCAREPQREREREREREKWEVCEKCCFWRFSVFFGFFWFFFSFLFLSFLSYNALSDFRHCVLKELSCNNFFNFLIFFSLIFFLSICV